MRPFKNESRRRHWAQSTLDASTLANLRANPVMLLMSSVNTAIRLCVYCGLGLGVMDETLPPLPERARAAYVSHRHGNHGPVGPYWRCFDAGKRPCF